MARHDMRLQISGIVVDVIVDMIVIVVTMIRKECSQWCSLPPDERG